MLLPRHDRDVYPEGVNHPISRAEQQAISKVAVHVGLDYHKGSIQVRIMDHDGKILANRPCPNRAEAVVARVAGHGQDVRAGIEACSGSADRADEPATRHGWVINLAHPGYVARMKQALDKTDWADARAIAELARVGYLPKGLAGPRGCPPAPHPSMKAGHSSSGLVALSRGISPLLVPHFYPSVGRSALPQWVLRDG